MKNRMLPPVNNVIINKIEYTEEFYEELKKRLFLALQKYKSSRKTRIIHHIIENNNFDLVLFSGEDSELIGKFMAQENKLFSILLNVKVFADFASENIVLIFGKIIEIIDKINEEKNIISDQRIFNLNKLQEEYNKYMQKFLDAFDYTKIIDGLYYVFLKYLFFRVYNTNPTLTKKFLLLNSQYLSKFLQYIYKKSTRMSVDDVLKEKINIISDYFILAYYYGDSVPVALKKIEQVYNKDAVEFLRKSNHLKCEKFENLADILFETDTIKIQKNVFDMFFKKEFGELGFKLIQLSKTTFDAFVGSINHKSILFNAITTDEKLSFTIEELILNEKSKIIIPEQIKKFI